MPKKKHTLPPALHNARMNDLTDFDVYVRLAARSTIDCPGQRLAKVIVARYPETEINANHVLAFANVRTDELPIESCAQLFAITCVLAERTQKFMGTAEGRAELAKRLVPEEAAA